MISTAPAPGGYPGETAASTASIVSASIISIAAGRIPAAMTRETASPAASVLAKPASSVRTASGTRRIRTVTATADAERPLGADEDAQQVGTEGRRG